MILMKKSLSYSIKQNYDNFETYILDDSKNKNYKKEIDKFAKNTK